MKCSLDTDNVARIRLPGVQETHHIVQQVTIPCEYDRLNLAYSGWVFYWKLLIRVGPKAAIKEPFGKSLHDQRDQPVLQERQVLPRLDKIW